jgi:hypothetical protein
MVSDWAWGITIFVVLGPGAPLIGWLICWINNRWVEREKKHEVMESASRGALVSSNVLREIAPTGVDYDAWQDEERALSNQPYTVPDRWPTREVIVLRGPDGERIQRAPRIHTAPNGIRA